MPWTVLPHPVTCGAAFECWIPADAPFWYSRATPTLRRCQIHADRSFLPPNEEEVAAARAELARNPLGLQDAAVKIGGGRQLSLMPERDPGQEG